MQKRPTLLTPYIVMLYLHVFFGALVAGLGVAFLKGDAMMAVVVGVLVYIGKRPPRSTRWPVGNTVRPTAASAALSRRSYPKPRHSVSPVAGWTSYILVCINSLRVRMIASKLVALDWPMKMPMA